MGVAKIKKFNCREYEFSPLVSNLSSYQIIHSYLAIGSLQVINILVVLLTHSVNFLLLHVNKNFKVKQFMENMHLLLHGFHSG